MSNGAFWDWLLLTLSDKKLVPQISSQWLQEIFALAANPHLLFGTTWNETPGNPKSGHNNVYISIEMHFWCAIKYTLGASGGIMFSLSESTVTPNTRNLFALADTCSWLMLLLEAASGVLTMFTTDSSSIVVADSKIKKSRHIHELTYILFNLILQNSDLLLVKVSIYNVKKWWRN